MPQLRKDPIVGRWVIVAAERLGRPNEFEHAPIRRVDTLCPFCEGHEDQSPPEVHALRAPGTRPGEPGWRVRVVPNKFPALELDAAVDPVLSLTGFDPAAQQGGVNGLYEQLAGHGVHEVIVESPRHLTSTTELSNDELAEVLEVYRARLTAWRDEPGLRYGLLFKNVGPAAGASLEHTHSQLIVTPIVPISVAEELAGSLEFFQRETACIYCRLVAAEQQQGLRLVAQNDQFVAFCPFASRFPLETWIVPRAHESHFEQATDAILAQLSQIMRRVIGGIEQVIERPAYNYIIHTGPFDTHALGHYHWHIEIIPRVMNIAGFEWGTGFYINPVSPEEAANRLRQALAS